jgi:hypothetical protein
MANDSFKIKKTLNLEPGAATMDSEGDVGFSSATHRLKIRDNSSSTPVATDKDLLHGQSRYVTIDGDDTNGDGSISNPWATPQKAIDEIDDAGGSNPYVVHIGPGDFSDDPVTGKDHVHLVGASRDTTWLGAYTGAAGHSFCRNISFYSTITLNTGTNEFADCWFFGSISGASVTFRHCDLSQPATVADGTTVSFRDTHCTDNVTVESGGTFNMYGGRLSGLVVDSGGTANLYDVSPENILNSGTVNYWAPVLGTTTINGVLTVTNDINGTTTGNALTDLSNLNSPTHVFAIANGGTGQTSQTAAFDALAPTTTKGDLIASNGSDNIRVAVGTNGQLLVADSGETSGIKWADPSATVTGTADKAAQFNSGTGALEASAVTTTELGRLSGVGSAVKGISDSATLTNKKLSDSTCTIVDDGDATKQLAFQCSGITTGTTRTWTVPDASSTLVGTDTTQTLTNKTMTDSSFTIADDGDSTKKVAFQCSGIATATTRTITIPDHSSTLATTGGSQTFTSKVYNGLRTTMTAVKTSNYTITTSDDIVLGDASGGAFTLTMPAANVSGRLYEIVNCGSGTNQITVARNGSDTFEGISTTSVTSITLGTYGERLVLAADGTSKWYVVAHSYPQAWQSYTPTGGWTNGGGTVTYAGKWRRVGDSMELEAVVTTTGSVTGTTFSLNLPTGYTIDTAKLSGTSTYTNLGIGNLRDNSATDLYGGLVRYNNTTSVLILVSTSGADPRLSILSASVPVTVAASDKVELRCVVPITGWM